MRRARLTLKYDTSTIIVIRKGVDDMKDPTRDEMLEALANYPGIDEADVFDIEQAVYWFCADCHGDQWTNTYRALCASPYTPGAIERAPKPDSLAGMMYWFLHDTYATVGGAA